MTGDSTASPVAQMVSHCPPGWETWLGITSNNEPLQVGMGGNFCDEMKFSNSCCLLSACSVHV